MEYGCIGEHLGHSFSKEIHNALADYEYVLKELTPEELPDFLIERDFKAINVTIPYKKDVIPFLDFISEEAKAINAVNTIVNKDGKLFGYNTDFYGLKALIEKENVSFCGKKVAILGSGGTSNTAYAVSKKLGASSVLKVSRNAKDGYITYNDLNESYSDCSVIINTTPCGMFPNLNGSAVDLDKLPAVEAVFDAVYNPLCSKLVLSGKKKGIVAVGGLYMLVSQAAFAVEKFIDTEISENKVQKVFEEIYKSKMNLVLIGMPSCGKTSIGKALSSSLNKSVVDSDDEIIKNSGKAISEIFEEVGESGFRELEINTIAEISKMNSLIIATGGGAVINEINIENLKANGRVYFIDRPLEALVTTDDRPLSSNKADLEKRYNERYKLYRKAADVIIDGSGSVQDVAKRIEAEFNEYSCN